MGTMRKTFGMLIAATMLAACDSATTPESTTPELAAVTSFSADVGSAGPREMGSLHRLPDDLKLTDEQEAQIRMLLDEFATDTKADRDALAALIEDAREAHRDGASRDSVMKLLAQADPIRERLAAAHEELKAAIDAVLTAEQKAWLEAHRPERRQCRDTDRLTDTQKNQIKALVKAFEDENRADLRLVADLHRRIQRAIREGKSRAEIDALRAQADAAIDRLADARAALTAALAEVLTDEQLESGCFNGRLTPNGHRGRGRGPNSGTN